jgi:hypothetical protein
VSHFGDPPLDNVAKMLVIDVVVLLSNTPLSAFLELILAIAEQNGQTSTWNQVGYAHFNERVIRKDCDNLIQLLGLQSHAASQIIVLEAARSSKTVRNHGLAYIHWMPCELIHDNGKFRLIKSSRDMLYEESQRFLVLLRSHESGPYGRVEYGADNK